MDYRLLSDRWLSTLAKIPCYQLVMQQPNALTPAIQALGSNPAFVYTKIIPHATSLLKEVCSQGFYLVDTNLQMQQSHILEEAPHLEYPYRITFIKETNSKPLRAIAENAFAYSRFYLDAQVNPTLSQQIKEAWLQQFDCGLRGDAMIVAYYRKRPIGFMQLVRQSRTQQWMVDLIAVHSRHQKRGVGKRLLTFANQKFGRLKTDAQLSNLSAVHFYEACGFSIQKAYYLLHYYHKHPSSTD